MLSPRFKKIVIAFTIAYCLSYLLQIFFPVYSQNRPQEEPLDHTNIVAVFVEKEVYDSVKSQVDRYAKDYMQKEMENTKAIVFPVDTKHMMAWDILKVLENLYFEGETDVPSQLQGVVLIGDIPFPVVQDKGFVFPTIYPYVDLEQQKFLRDKQTQFFVPTDNAMSKPELWHGVIRFSTPAEYATYFQRLKGYDANRSTFVAKKIRYDDFVNLQQTFSTEIAQYYVNSFLFAEDVAYNRFTNLLLSFLQGDHDAGITSMFTDAIANAEENVANVDAEE